MTAHRIQSSVGILLILLAVGCSKSEQTNTGAPQPDVATASTKDLPVAVSSPYLEAAVREVLPKDVPMFQLAGPSMCPGHFDMRPSQMSELARCGLLVRFDFQKKLDEKLANKCQTAAVTVRGGLCVPETYVSACSQVADHLVQAGFLSRDEADARLAMLTDRMAALQKEVEHQVRAAHLLDAPVLASGHQADFCRWLGLRMIAETSSADSCSIRDLDEALKEGLAAGVKTVIANEPEGRRASDALAERLDAKVVVFANFPKSDKTSAFDDLVRRNLAALLEACSSDERKP